MNRRRALLAASQTGGGKIVNHGVLTIEQGNKSFVATIVFDFPCASTISIHIISSIRAINEGISEGNISRSFMGLGKFQSFTYSPTEDDTYIYEITIEQ